MAKKDGRAEVSSTIFFIIVKGGLKMSILILICSITVVSYLIVYALVCINSPKMIFFEIKGITNRWIYLEEIQ